MAPCTQGRDCDDDLEYLKKLVSDKGERHARAGSMHSLALPRVLSSLSLLNFCLCLELCAASLSLSPSLSPSPSLSLSPSPSPSPSP